MEKKNLLIKDYEDKKSPTTGKRYTRFETNLGWYSAFDKEVIDPIKELEGKWALCGVVETEKNKNIREFHGPGKAEGSESETASEPVESADGTAARLMSLKDVSIVAQCLTKCVCRIMITKENADEKEWIKTRREVIKSYQNFATELENAGEE